MQDTPSFRQVMGNFPTGVTVVASRGKDGELCGLTVNSFASVSLDPPLVLTCIDHASSTRPCILDASSFTVSILAATQEEIATRFAFHPAETRFREGEWRTEVGGELVVAGAAAWLVCALEAVHDAGDHAILVGKVLRHGRGTGEALVFYQGRYGAVSE